MKLNSVAASKFLAKELPLIGKTRKQWTQWLNANRRNEDSPPYVIPFTSPGKGPLGCRLTKISYERDELEEYVQWLRGIKSTSRHALGHILSESMKKAWVAQWEKLNAPTLPAATLSVKAVEPEHLPAVQSRRFAVSCLLKGGENGKIDQELSVEAGSSENEAIGMAVMAALGKSGGNLALLDISCVPVG